MSTKISELPLAGSLDVTADYFPFVVASGPTTKRILASTFLSSAVPGGTNAQVQYNNNGALGGATNVTYAGGGLVVSASSFVTVWSHGSNVPANGAFRFGIHPTFSNSQWMVFKSGSTEYNLVGYDKAADELSIGPTGGSALSSFTKTLLYGATVELIGDVLEFWINPSTKVGSFAQVAGDYQQFGTNPATTGTIRFEKNSSIVATNGNVKLLTYNENNTVVVGDTTAVSRFDASTIYMSASLVTSSLFKAKDLTGSLTQLQSGISYLVGVGGIAITTQSNGQVFISGSGGGGGSTSPGGSTTQLQYNNAGSFGGISTLTFSSNALQASLPVTASVGISASFVSVGANPSLAGAFRLPYNAVDTVIGAKDSGGTDRLFLGRTSGDTWQVGHSTAFNLNVYGYSFEQWGANYYALVNKNGSGYFLYANQTTASDFLALGSSPATDGNIRLAQSGSINSADDIRFINSGAISRVFNSTLRSMDVVDTVTTQNGVSARTLMTFSSSSNGRTYATDVVLTAQSTTTTGSGLWKFTGHYYKTGGTIGIVGVVDTPKSSSNDPKLVAFMTSSAGNIFISASSSTSTETYHWGCFMRVQEQG